MDFNLGQMFANGLVPAENNMVLTYLSYFFSNGIVFGGQSGEDSSVYMVLLGTFSVFYLAISLMIVVFLSAQKAYLTARDKEYAGQEDKNKLFALLMVLVMAMLSPVPGHNGLSLSQYISIKLFVAGSNLADWTAIKFLNISSMTGGDATEDGQNNPNPDQRNVRYYAFKRFIDSTQKFNCAKALVAHNYFDPTGSVAGLNTMTASSVYRALRSECGIPYTLVDTTYPDLRKRISPDTIGRIDAENLSAAALDKATYIKEMGCYAIEYEKLVNPVTGYMKVDRTSGELGFTPRFKSAVENKAIWQSIALNSVQCLVTSGVIYQDQLGNYVKAKSLEEAKESSGSNSSPANGLKNNPQGGWVALGDHFNDAREVGNEGGVNSGAYEQAKNLLDYDIEARIDPINAPLKINLDSRLKANVDKVDAAFSAVLQKVTENGWLDWNPERGPGSDSNFNEAARNTTGVITFALFLDNLTSVFLPGGNTYSYHTLRKFSDPRLLKAINKAGPLRGAAKIKAISKISSIFMRMKNKADKVNAAAAKKEGLAAAIPGIGPLKIAKVIISAAISAVNSVFEIIADIFGTSVGKLLFWIVTFISFLEFVPKLILGYVAFIWIYQCALFVFTAPLGITIALLPKTRIGHDTWKMGLALMMKPFLYVICFILSIIMIDVSLEFAWDTMMGGYVWSTTGIMQFILEMMNGTLLLKLTAFLGFYLLLFVVSMYSILNGPDEILTVLGITRTGPGSVKHLENKIGHYGQDVNSSGPVGIK